MTTQKALDIIRAVNLLSKTFEEKPQEFIGSLCFLYGERRSKLNEAIEINNKFVDADVVERGRMLGIKVVKGMGGYKSEVVFK